MKEDSCSMTIQVLTPPYGDLQEVPGPRMVSVTLLILQSIPRAIIGLLRSYNLFVALNRHLTGKLFDYVDDHKSNNLKYKAPNFDPEEYFKPTKHKMLKPNKLHCS